MVPHAEVPKDMVFKDAADVFAALLVGKRGMEKVEETARAISVMAHVVPNQVVFADYLTGLTDGVHRVTPA